ncbi:hypothetical protein Syun_013731 [Stephania yunnanensis]|uniref:Uncharacterized protein n=1 Tax=Stephania yunnanensis TaxID=152371 RepID=A0AAP0JJ23_9MAGN
MESIGVRFYFRRKMTHCEVEESTELTTKLEALPPPNSLADRSSVLASEQGWELLSQFKF